MGMIQWTMDRPAMQDEHTSGDISTASIPNKTVAGQDIMVDDIHGQLKPRLTAVLARQLQFGMICAIELSVLGGACRL